MMAPQHKDSGVAWIGQVPNHWQIRPAFSVLDELVEKNFESRVQNVLSLSYGKIVRRDVKSNFGLLPQSFESYQVVRPGDIVLRLLDLQNDHVSLRVGLVPEEGIVTSAYLSVRPKDGLDSRFAAYLLHAYDIMKVFYSFGGGCRQSMGFEDLRRLPIPFPPIPEQHQIVRYLDKSTTKVDQLIDLRRQQMELLSEQRAALIQQAVTGGLNKHVQFSPANIDWIDCIPKHWRTSKLSRLTSAIGDGLHGTPIFVDESPFYFINGNNLVDGDILLTPATRCVDETEFHKHRLTLGRNTLLMSINGTLGNVAFYQGESIVLGKSAAYINCTKTLTRSFLFYILQCETVRRFLEGEATGTTILNLSLESIRNLWIPFPDIDEQREIVSHIKRHTAKLDALFKAYERQLALLMEYRAALIHQCVTGERTVHEPACLGESS
jgi:type I restriction enzyme, S subunit